MISSGGVLRDFQKNWLGGLAVNKGRGCVLKDELWGIFEGLKIAWDAGFRRIIVESNSKSIVDLLLSGFSDEHPLFSLLDSCRALIKGYWICLVQHVYRELNRTIDGIANLG
ncbi:hypothetical protein ACOSQ2_010946 [Xanthoceras sorbifolium]